MNLSTSEFSVEVDLGKFTIKGEYEAEGGYGIGEPLDLFRGAGNWELTSDSPQIITGPYVQVSVENFGITSDGFVDMSAGSVARSYASLHEGSFENLEAGDIKELVNDRLSFEQQQHSRRDEWFPLPSYLEMFLKEVFAKTPLSDIIGSN